MASSPGPAPSAPAPAPVAPSTRPAKGKLLVASPRLADPNFSETVVLLLQHSSGGAVGVVVNRRSGVPLAEAMRDVPELAGRPEELYLGGPVDPFRVLLVVRSRERPEDALQILDEVWVTGSLEALKRLLKEEREDAPFRIYAGYAGWAGGQLESEIRRGDWLVADGDAAAIFDGDPRSLWKRLVDRLMGQWVSVSPSLRRTSPSRPPSTLRRRG